MYVVPRPTSLFQRVRPLGLIVVLAALIPLALRAETQTGSTGSGSPVANSQPSLGITWVIATQGVFPSREGVVVAEPLIGEIRPISYPAASMNSNSGWVECQGQILTIQTNQALFSLIGTQFGGNGVTTFALPDLRGRVPIGMGAGPGLTERVIGETLGDETHILSAAHLPAHTHTTSGGATGSTGSA